MRNKILVLIILYVFILTGCKSSNYFNNDKYLCIVVDKEYMADDSKYILYLDIWDIEEENLVEELYSKEVSKSVYNSYKIGDYYRE